MSLFDDLIANETIAAVRNRIVQYAKAADLAITNWIVGGTGEQVLATMTEAVYATGLTVAKVIRGFASLDTSTDPGDDDPFDPNQANLTPAPGMLSQLGRNVFGTTRRESTFATGFVTFVNAGQVARTFAPDALTFTWTVNPPAGSPPTYRNSADAAIYTNPDGTVTVAAGAQLVVPVSAEEIGTRSSAPPGALSLTTTLSGCSATNASAISGTARESAVDYRKRCRQAPARVSLGGPADAIKYLASTQLDGEPLLNASGNAVNITRVWVSAESETGVVDAFYASPSGAAVAEDVTAANGNIELDAYSVFDAVTFTGQAAVEVALAVGGSVKVKAGVGVTADAVRSAIVAALAKAFEGFEIGGFDQVDGAGVLYTEDLQTIAGASYPGLYAVAVTTPAGATTALARGRVAVLQTQPADWAVTIT